MNPEDRTGCVVCSRQERFNDNEAAERAVDIFLKWGWFDTRPCPDCREDMSWEIIRRTGRDPGFDLTDLPTPTSEAR